MRVLVPLLVAAAAAGAGAVALWWLRPPDPTAVLRSRLSPLARLERVAAPELGAGIERWRLIDARGDTTHALWQPAPPEASSPWTIVMMAGARTGDRAVLLLPSGVAANVLAVDWPWSGPRRLSGWRFFRAHLAIRDAALRSPAILALAVEGLAREPRVTPSRVAFLGASLGVPPVLAALELTDAPKALILVHGAADIEGLMRHALRGRSRPRWLAPLLASYGARLVHPLEPALHFAKASRIPTLIVVAEADDWLHPRGIAMLREGIPNAVVVDHPGGHVLPGQPDVIAELTREVVAWLDGLPELS